MLRLFLNGSHLWWRLAFELSSEIYGEQFHIRTRALDEELLKQAIPENGSFLDIGCGYGEWCRKASKFARKVIGIDTEISKIQEAKKLTNACNVEYRVADATVDLPGQRFDVALLSHVIEYIDDIDSFLRFLRQIAETIIVEVPDFEHDPLNWVRVRQSCPFYTDGDHVREYTLNLLSEQLKKTGWRISFVQQRHGSMVVIAQGRNSAVEITH
jgi:SAM-dependent methyltransferase